MIVEYSCVCMSMDHEWKMLEAMGLAARACGARIGRNWVCTRPRGHNGEHVACQRMSGIAPLHGDWHGVTKVNPWGTFCTVILDEPPPESMKFSPHCGPNNEQWEDK